MTVPSASERRQTLVNLLVQIAREQRAAPAYYGNLSAVPGGLQFRRLLSSTGFAGETSLTYVTPAATNVRVGSEPRTNITKFRLHPYGGELDVQRLTSTDGPDRQLHTTAPSNGRGIVLYPLNPDYVMPGYVSSDTAASNKDVEFVLDMTTPSRGKSWHFYVNRAGALIVGAAFDDIASLEGSDETTIDVAYETLVLVTRSDHSNNQVNGQTLIEAPLTAAQVQTLAILTAKVETATRLLLEIVPEHFLRIPSDNWVNGNFSNGTATGLPFDYVSSDFEAFFDIVDALPNFDLSVDIFRPSSSVEQIDRREQARTAISSTDTLGTRATLLANYSSVSAASRAQDMQDRPRMSYFLRRAEASTQAAVASTQQATATADADAGDDGADGAPQTPAAPPNPAAYIYNFRTGKWADGESV